MKRLAWIVGLVAASALVIAKWAVPASVPVTRLIANAEAKVRADSSNGQARFLLARLYSLRYAGQSDQVPVYDPDRDPKLPAWERIQVSGPAKRTPAAADSLFKSITQYEYASQLLPKDAKIKLGQGWMFEEASKWVSAKEVDAPADRDLRKQTRKQWLQRAVDAYRKSYELSKVEDASKEHQWLGLEDMASLEAAGNLLRLADAKQASLSPAFRNELQKHVADLKVRPTMVTPIVFPLNGATPFAAIDNPLAKVRFDLDGSGLPRRWSWITPRAAFLCWNPLGDGRIDSARDLFGNATFWMFFRNGYDALAALEDNRDGMLTGTELRFIGIWHDRNSNGLSEAGEVRPLSALGIVSIAVRPEGRRGATWFNRSGIGLRNGKTLPTYDWVARRQL